MTDCFDLLGEPRRPWLDAEALKSRFLLLSAEAHPDRVHGGTDEAKAAAGAGHRGQAVGPGHVEPFEPDAAERGQTLGERHEALGCERAEPSLRQRLTCGVGINDIAAIAGHHDQRRMVADKGR
jgi:hypothetical protein